MYEVKIDSVNVSCFCTDYIAWRGRYYAFGYEAFEHFMRYVLAQVMGRNSLPPPDPWEPEFDMDSSIGKCFRQSHHEYEFNR